MSSWLPANLFKSAPAQRSWGEEEGRSRVTGLGARGAGRGSGVRSRQLSCPSLLLPGVCSQGRGVQGWPGAMGAHLCACGSAGILLAPRAARTACRRVSRARRSGFSALAFVKDIYTLQALRLVCLQTGFCLSPKRRVGKGETWANSTVDFSENMQGLHLSASPLIQQALTRASACQPRGLNTVYQQKMPFLTVQNLSKGVFWEVLKSDDYYKNWEVGKKLILYVS